MGLFTRSYSKSQVVRDELDDHLAAINENADELVEVRDALCQLDEKIEKVTARLDELYLLLGAETSVSSAEAAVQAFLQSPRSLGEVAAFLNDSLAAAERVLRTLCLKGVAVHPISGEHGLSYTTNMSSVKHVSLHKYF